MTPAGSLRTSVVRSCTVTATVWLPSESPVGSNRKFDDVAFATFCPSTCHWISGLLPAGTMCVIENCCVEPVLTATLLVVGENCTIVLAIEFVSLLICSLQTAHSATPSVRMRQLFFGR